MRRATVSTALVLALLTLSAAARTSDPAAAEGGSVASAQPFFFNGAVDAHLASPAQRVPADAYFEGGYRLLSWDFLAAVVVMWMLLRFCWSVRMRDLAERVSRFNPLPTSIGCNSLCWSGSSGPH